MQSKYECVSDFVNELPKDVDQIAICGTSYSDIGGVARVIEQQASELHAAGYQVDIFCLEGSRAPPEGVVLNVMGHFSTSPYKEIDKLLTLASIESLNFVRQSEKFDLIIAHRFPFSTLAHLCKYVDEVTYVYWSHPSKSSDQLFDGLAYLWARFQHHLETKNYAIKQADYICAVSEESRDYISSKTNRDSIVVPNKITESRFDNVVDGQSVESQFNFSSGDSIILHVGRISPRKNVHKLVEIFDEISVPDTKLVLVGEENMPEYSERVRKLANDDVILTGFVEDEILAGLYNRASVYATCSLSEGWGLPLSEADHFGLPIVAFDSIPAVSSIEDGYPIPEGEYDTFKENLKKLASQRNSGEETNLAGGNE